MKFNLQKQNGLKYSKNDKSSTLPSLIKVLWTVRFRSEEVHISIPRSDQGTTCNPPALAQAVDHKVDAQGYS